MPNPRPRSCIRTGGTASELVDPPLWGVRTLHRHAELRRSRAGPPKHDREVSRYRPAPDLLATMSPDHAAMLPAEMSAATTARLLELMTAAHARKVITAMYAQHGDTQPRTPRRAYGPRGVVPDPTPTRAASASSSRRGRRPGPGRRTAAVNTHPSPRRRTEAAREYAAESHVEPVRKINQPHHPTLIPALKRPIIRTVKRSPRNAPPGESPSARH